MAPDDVKALARRFVEELLTQGDLAVARDLFTEDCRHHAPGPVASGAAGIAAWVAELRQAFPDLWAIIEEEIAQEGRVALRLSLGGTQEGMLDTLPAGGQRARWQQITILHAGPDGRFVAVWSSWDRLGLLTQLGVRADAGDEARAPPREVDLP